MTTSKRHQDLWLHRPNNSSLQVHHSSSQYQNIYSFCQHFNHHYLPKFVHLTINIHTMIKLQEPPLFVDTQDALNMVEEILKQQQFVFIDAISELRHSYKGYISWLFIATHSRLYLIDAARLHDQCQKLKQVLERKDLIKFMHDCQDTIFALKRDWQIFIPNVFDLEFVQRYLSKNGKNSLQPKFLLKQYLSSSTNPINTRPVKSITISKFQDYFESQIQILLNLDKFFTSSDQSYHCYAYFNHYSFLLKHYSHLNTTVREKDQIEKTKRGVNSFAKYGTHQEITQQSFIGKEHQFWQKDSQEEHMATMLCEWREHIAKMRDVCVEQVLPYETLSKLVKTKVNSILQISELCSPSHISHPPIYSLSLEDFEQIFQLFQLQKQQFEESIHELSIPRRLPYFKPTEEKPIKELFSEIKFTDQSYDWLNKKTDQSVRLYKEILSINQFDNSIVQEYMKEMTKNSSTLNVQDINRYVKYAQCLRVGNHKKLQELYEQAQSQQILKNPNFSEQYFQQNFIQGDEYKNWEEIEQELNFPTMDTINQPRSNQSLTSLKSITNLRIQSCKNFTTNQSTSVLKQKQLNSLRVLESPSIFSKIEPLPQSIEAIYLEAAKAKKDYATKGQKKNSKGNKKETKAKIENNYKKEQDFVPKKEEIFNLIYY